MNSRFFLDFSDLYVADPYSFFKSGYYNKDSIKNKLESI